MPKRAHLFAASAAIKDSAWLNKEIKHVNKWNVILFKEFKKMKIIKNKSFTNFILIIFALLYEKYKLPILICSILLVLSLLFWLSKKKS